MGVGPTLTKGIRSVTVTVSVTPNIELDRADWTAKKAFITSHIKSRHDTVLAMTNDWKYCKLGTSGVVPLGGGGRRTYVPRTFKEETKSISTSRSRTLGKCWMHFYKNLKDVILWNQKGSA
jgi:hypothetical protein